MEHVIGIEVGRGMQDGVVRETVQDFENRWSILMNSFDDVGCCIIQQALDRVIALLKHPVMLFKTLTCYQV